MHEITPVKLDSIHALTQITKGEVDLQVATAHKYPRDLKRVLSEIGYMMTLDEDTAASMNYSLPRGGKAIEGPSVRAAEIIANAWGNLRVETRVLDADQSHVTAQAMCWDLEKNVAIRTEVKRRITDKHGRRFNDDMIVVTGNAASAIALRNAVFKVIPAVHVKPILEQAKAMACKDAQTLSSRRTAAINYFHRFGVTDEGILAVVGKDSVEQLGMEEVSLLRGLAQAIKEGTTTIDEAFPEAQQTKGSKGLKESLKSKRASSKGEEQEPEKAEPEAEQADSDDDPVDF